MGGNRSTRGENQQLLGRGALTDTLRKNHLSTVGLEPTILEVQDLALMKSIQILTDSVSCLTWVCYSAKIKHLVTVT